MSRASLKLLGSLGAPCGPVAPSPSQAYNPSHGAEPLLAPVPQVLQPHIVPLPSPYPSHLICPPSSSLLIHCSSAFPGLSCNEPRDGAPSSLPHAFLVNLVPLLFAFTPPLHGKCSAACAHPEIHLETHESTGKVLAEIPLGSQPAGSPVCAQASILRDGLFFLAGMVLGRHWRGTRALRACFTPTWSHLCCDMLVGTRPNASGGHLPALGRGEHALTSPRANSLPNASSKSLLRMWPAEMPTSKWAATPWH